jgi:MinD-like ATPase involved in chromosome partitioning or flagellar assembly
VDRTEAAWDRAEPTPRWRSLLDRARAGGRSGADDADYRDAHAPPVPPQRRPDDGPDRGRATPAYRGAPPQLPPAPGTTYGGSTYGAGSYGGTTYGGGNDTRDRRPPSAPVSAPAGGRPDRNGVAHSANGSIDQLVATLRKPLGGPKVLAFANPKGGVHKTTATVLAAATVGGVRGRGVLAWDDNELRGTLGLRAGSARHARTIRHLIRDLALIEATPGNELLPRLDEYLRHASDGSYDVLAGEESPRFAHQLDPYTVRRVLDLLRRTHEVICVDTGNNVESANWQTVLQMADQLVITTVPREDAAFTADWMLDLLHEIGLGHLADNAVTLLSCATPNPSPLLGDLARHFGSRTRAVTVVPYDPVLEIGSSIEHTQLSPATRRAWLHAAATMFEQFR